LTGGGSGHQIYINGERHHVLRQGTIVEHLVELAEKKAAEIEAEKAKEEEAKHAQAAE